MVSDSAARQALALLGAAVIVLIFAPLTVRLYMRKA